MSPADANKPIDDMLIPRRRLPSRPSASEIEERDPALVVDQPAVLAYALENLFVMLWRGATTDVALDDVHAALERVVAQHEEGIAIVSIIQRGAPPPSSAHRGRVREFQETLSSRLRCLAIVIEGMGFWASAVLGAATAIISARRVRFPQKVCRTHEEAVLFIASKCEGTPAGDGRMIMRAFDFVHADATLRASR